MRADSLLTELTAIIGAPDVTLVEAPQRLTGGFFTENHRFRLAHVPPPWDTPLVVRLFPVVVPDDVVRLEAVVQGGVATAGLPAPPVVHFDPDARLDGRRYFVMEGMPGRPLLGDIGVGAIVRHGPRLLRRLASITADVQAQLHAIDPAPIVAELGHVPIGLDRWFDNLQDLIDAGASGFVGARRWLVENQPTDRPTNVICHGDLHPGNILVDGDLHVTAVLDWTVATLAEPALELGFTTMAFSLVPLEGPSVVQRLARRVGRGISRRYVRAYLARNPVDVSTQPYYEALRCAMEVGGVARWRLAVADGRGAELLRPTWDSIGDVMVDYFRSRTDVELTLPPAVQAG